MPLTEQGCRQEVHTQVALHPLILGEYLYLKNCPSDQVLNRKKGVPHGRHKSRSELLLSKVNGYRAKSNSKANPIFKLSHSSGNCLASGKGLSQSRSIFIIYLVLINGRGVYFKITFAPCKFEYRSYVIGY
jgi:hypothetical protein